MTKDSIIRKGMNILIIITLVFSLIPPSFASGTANENGLKVSWNFDTTDSITVIKSNEYGTEWYVGTESGLIYKFDERGNEIWVNDSHTASIDRIVIGKSIIGIERSDNSVYILNRETGVLDRVFNDTNRVYGIDTSPDYNFWCVASQLSDNYNLSTLHIHSSNTETAFTTDGIVPNSIRLVGGISHLIAQSSTNLKQAVLLKLSFESGVPGCVEGMLYSQSLTHTSSNINQYPQKVIIHRSTGTTYEESSDVSNIWHVFVGEKCKTDYGDIRFIHDNNFLDYYLHPNFDSNKAEFTVMLDKTNDTTTTEIWYGNLLMETTSIDEIPSDPTYPVVFYDDCEVVGDWILTGSMSLGSDYAYAGDYGFGHPGQSSGSASKTINIPPASVLEFWAKRSYSKYSGGDHSDVYIDTDIIQSLPPDGEWHKYTLNIGDYVGNHTLMFKGVWGGVGDHYAGNIIFDEIRIYTRLLPTLVTYEGELEHFPPSPLSTKVYDSNILEIVTTNTFSLISTEDHLYLQEIDLDNSLFNTTIPISNQIGVFGGSDITNDAISAIIGRGNSVKIYRYDGVMTGTYDTGGLIGDTHLSRANGLYALATSADGKYYVFSKDEASMWYMLHSSLTGNEITASYLTDYADYIAVARGSDLQVLTLEEAEGIVKGSITLRIYDGSNPYADKPIIIQHSEDGVWTESETYTTDNQGVVVIEAEFGKKLNVIIGDNIHTRTLIPTPAQPEYIIQIPFDEPLRSGANYKSWYDDDTGRIYFTFEDKKGKTSKAEFKIIRNSDSEVVYTKTFLMVYGDTTEYTGYYTIPVSERNTSYRVSLTVHGSPSFSNSWHQWISGSSGVASLPIELSDSVKTGIFMVLILFVGGIFSYFSGPHGAVVVALMAGMFVFWGWLPISPAVVGLCIVWAFLGLLGRTSVG